MARDEFKLYHVDMTPFPAHTAELERQVVICNGYERPRFVDTGRKVGGYLGIDDWGDYWQKPSFDSLIGGSLDASKFYSVMVVPMDTEQAYLTGPLVGSVTMPAIPHSPTEASGGIRWTIPEHTQWETLECGTADDDSTDGVTDTTKEWTADQWADHYVWNPRTGERTLITSNTDTELVADGFDMTLASEDLYYAIQRKTVKRRVIYVAEMDAPSGLIAATFHFHGYVDGAEETTWNLTSFATSTTVPDTTIIQPPNAFVAHQAGNKMFIGGGILEQRGTAKVDVTQEDIQATAEADEAIDVARVSALRDPVAARLQTSHLRFIAQAAGVGGNSIRVGFLNTGADALSVDVTGNDISVTLKTDEGSKAKVTWGQIYEPRIEVQRDVAGIEGNDWNVSFMYQQQEDADMQAHIDGNTLLVRLGTDSEAGLDPTKNTTALIVEAINEIDAGFTATALGDPGSIGTVGEARFRGGANPVPLSTAAEIKDAIDGSGAAAALVSVEVTSAGVESARGLANLSGGESATASIGQDNPIYGRFMRYTLQSGLADLVNVAVGSVVTVTNSNNAANNVTDTLVTRVDPYMRWFEVRNDNGVASSGNEAMTIAIIHNVVEGTETFFSEAMKGGTILFGADSEPFTIAAVDRINQRLSLASKYTGKATGDAGPFQIRTFNELYWSDDGNPHTYRDSNFITFPEPIKAISSYQEVLIVFCERNIYVHSIENPNSVPQRITSAQVRITAPWSIAASPSYGVLFWDGNGFSVCDGVRVVSVTQNTCQWLMEGVHREMEWNIRSIWNNMEQRWEVAFPYGGDATNNYGLYITGADRRVYGIQIPDVNALWTAAGSDGEPVIRHGTSARHTGNTGGVVFDHIPTAVTDALPDDSSFVATIVSHNRDTNTIRVHSDAEITALPGTPVLLWPQGASNAYYKTFIFASITEDEEADTPHVYDLVYSDDWDVDSAGMGDLLLIGGIVADYGIKWTDFGSPHLRHNVRRIEIDVEPFSGFMLIDHFADNNEATPIFTSSHIVTNQHKITSTPKRGAHYTYGFRVRCVSGTRLRIDNVTILFDPVV